MKELTCNLLNKGIGYRSENYSIEIAPSRPHFNFDGGGVSLTVYTSGFSIYNPSGSYLNLNWKIFVNKTHYTVMFQTSENNLVQFIEFNIIAYDFTYIKNVNYQRSVSLGLLTCPSTNCLGTGNWYAGVRYSDVNRQFWGMSGFNFTKNEEINWYLNTSSYADHSIGYIHSPGVVSVQVSGFIDAIRQCVDFDPALDEYFDPASLTCKTACPPSYPHKNPIAKLCSKCHYSCATCASYKDTECKSCNTGFQRYNTSSGILFSCACKTQYLDVGIGECKKCSILMPGCDTCDTFRHCQICKTGLKLNQDSTGCQCINQSHSMTWSGQCIELTACLSYLIDTNRSILCTQCDAKNNFVMVSFECQCKNGYGLHISGKKCIQKCGNKIKTDSEGCDDGNLVEDDGCSNKCIVEEEYVCFQNIAGESICIYKEINLTYHMTLKNTDKENYVDAYFSLKPWNDKIIESIDLFKLFFHSSLENQEGRFSDAQYSFWEDQLNEIRFSISVKFLQQIDETKSHDMTFQNSSIKASVAFNLKLPQNSLHFQTPFNSSYKFFNFSLLICIVVGYIIFFLSMLSQNWIGIQTMLAFQSLFFYCFLMESIDDKLLGFVEVLKFSIGYNDVGQQFSAYGGYSQDGSKLFILGYAKEFVMNFNFSSILFVLPFLLLAIRCVNKKCGEKQSKNYRLITKKIGENENQVKQRHSAQGQSNFCLNKVTTVFIMSRVLFSAVFVNLFQSVFSFYIQQSQYQKNTLTFSNLLMSIYMFGVLSLVIGLIVWVYMEILSKDELSRMPLRRLIRFQGFKVSYPLFYITLQIIKFLVFLTTYEQSYCVYLMIGFEGLGFLVYIIYKPYTIEQKQGRDSVKPNRCSIINNLHNVWNCAGSVGLLIIVICCNKSSQDAERLSLVFVFYVLAFCYFSLALALIRLFSRFEVFSKCQKEQVYSIQKKLNDFELQSARVDTKVKQLKSQLLIKQKQQIKNRIINVDSELKPLKTDPIRKNTIKLQQQHEDSVNKSLGSKEKYKPYSISSKKIPSLSNADKIRRKR